MPKTYTLTEVAKALEADAKTLRRWVELEGWNLGKKGENPMNQTSKYDERIKWLTEEQVILLAKAHERAWPPRPKTPAQIQAQGAGLTGAVHLIREDVTKLKDSLVSAPQFTSTVEVLQEQISALEDRLEALEIWKASLESKPKPVRASRKAKAGEDDGDDLARPPLPADLIGWREFARTHNVPLSTVQKAVEAGRLPILQGEWKDDRQIIRGVLDTQGRARFFEMFAEKTQYWQACPDCPHSVGTAQA